MPIKAVQSFSSWSYSRLTEWEKCPFKAMCKHFAKIKEPEPEPGSPLFHGKEAHQAAEDYLNHKIRGVPKLLCLFTNEFEQLRKKHPQPEYELALTTKWEPTGWFDAAAWLRIKIDVLWTQGSTIHIVDYKTGKIREEQEDQLELYAVGAFSMLPAPAVAGVSLWYLDQGETRPLEGEKLYDGLTESAGLRRKWEKRVAPMLADTAFVPKPGNHCRWCHLQQSKGGPCRF